MKNLESFEKFTESALESIESIQINGGHSLIETGCCSDGKTPSDLYDSVEKRMVYFEC
jgi:hypothetical protein